MLSKKHNFAKMENEQNLLANDNISLDLFEAVIKSLLCKLGSVFDIVSIGIIHYQDDITGDDTKLRLYSEFINLINNLRSARYNSHAGDDSNMNLLNTHIIKVNEFINKLSELTLSD